MSFNFQIHNTSVIGTIFFAFDTPLNHDHKILHALFEEKTMLYEQFTLGILNWN